MNHQVSANTPVFPSWAIKLLVAVAIPTIACVGLYGLDPGESAASPRALLSIAAYPVLLISAIGLLRSRATPWSADTRGRWKWALALAASAAMLVVSRL